MDKAKIDKYLDKEKKIDESEDGAGTMTYTAMHPHGGRGRQGHNKGIKCPHCGKNIDLRRE